MIFGDYSTSTKDFPLEIKSFDEAGVFRGLAAAYDLVDEQRDRIARGAFTKTLAEHGGKRPLLWQHDINQPLGFGTLIDTNDGLLVTGHLCLEVKKAREVHSLMKQANSEGTGLGLSIGYSATKAEWQGSTRLLKEIRLYEVSPTMFASNPAALVSSVKSAPYDEATDEEARELMDLFREMSNWTRARLARR